MIEQADYETPRFEEEESSGGPKTVIAMVICAAGVFLILPFTQYISGGGDDKSDVVTVDVALPPPPPPPPEPPPPENEKVEEPPPEMQRNVQQLSLSQMDLALNPGFGDAMAGAFAFEGFGVEPDTVGDLQIFDVSDLDQPPRRVKTVLPVYPAELRRMRINGMVSLILIIDTNGTATVEKVVSSTAREFTQPAIDAIEQCLFETPTKNGEPVRARYKIDVPFRIQ
ncbi:energy transducer TonB [Pelagicoccus sp. SDUM812003]|uniref:energy transducer TonB n=1 Tax=Pelagicoccus sp. SDUM812003 TaxID=3041267 RepID=UPI00280DEFC1|nr:energy transducer TonB [Pelagicoccus sp. SDUM812003]MDQ8204694.1 energy transducer TonB [Pelagicoccus sp. SDUM812003]